MTRSRVALALLAAVGVVALVWLLLIFVQLIAAVVLPLAIVGVLGGGYLVARRLLK